MFENIINKIKNSFNFNQNSNRIYRRNRMYMNRSMLNYKLVTFEDAKNMIDKNEILVLDVRSKEEYDIMHIKNSINIPVDEIEKKIAIYPTTQSIMVYCSTGTRSKIAIKTLNMMGYTNIYIWEYASLANFPFKNMLVYR